MPISSADIVFYLSGGASNTDPDLSLGGARSTTAITEAAQNNLFDDISTGESTAGDTEYRCFYVRNDNGASPGLTLSNAVVWLQSDTPNSDTSIEIGLGTSAVGTATSEPTASPNDESTAPASVTFSAPTTKAAGLSIGDMAAGEHKAIWVKRIVSASASSYFSDSCIIRVEGDTS